MQLSAGITCHIDSYSNRLDVAVESFIDLMHSVQFRNDFFAWKIQNKILFLNATLYSDSKKYLDVEVMLKNV